MAVTASGENDPEYLFPLTFYFRLTMSDELKKVIDFRREAKRTYFVLTLCMMGYAFLTGSILLFNFLRNDFITIGSIASLIYAFSFLVYYVCKMDIRLPY